MESLQRVVGEMAESRTVAVTPLNGSNYVTWRVQCKMALMKEGLWNIVCGTEVLSAIKARLGLIFDHFYMQVLVLITGQKRHERTFV